MIEKHQQTNGIGRGKITINPEYIKRAREITVGGQPVKILSSNPNTGRVLAQFPDGHTEEVKAAPDYFIGGNTSTKELKNNQPIYGETNTAANERADSQDEAHDLTPIFSNLITAGQISTMNEGAQDLQNGKYLEGTTKLLSPAMFGSGIGGIAARSGIGGYNLFNKNGVRKTYNLFNQGNYGEGALSLLGDAFNAAMATEGLGSISNALKGTSGYRNWRLANAINKGVKENAVITAYNRNPVAKDIGNLWDYQSYLDNVFPNSKVKYVLWHGSRSKNLETFNTNMIGSHMPIKNSVGMYLTPERNIAVGYGTRGSVYPVLLNTENPFITNQFFGGISKNGVNVTKISPKVRRTLLANNDAVIAPRRGEIAFFDPDNTLILGSNRDMQGFQKFMKSSPEKRIPHQPQLQYQKEPSTSLKFFERPQSKISEAERLGIPKGERNQPFKQKQLTEHTQGEEAVKMFKEYGGTPIPEGSINGEQLRKYVAEARERYGLIGNNNITDEEIAQALYKHINEQNVSINPLTNEPLIGFRGDTQRYTQLKKRMSPEELAKRSGTMDNSLGNLFLGEMPHNYQQGLDRYLVTARPEPHFAFPDKVVLNPNSSATGANYQNLMTEFPSFEELFKQQYFSYPLRQFIGRRGHNLGTIYKVKPEYTNTGVNDINAFMFRGKPRIASDEIQVGNVGRAMSGKPIKFNLMTKETPKIDTTDPEELTYIWENNKMNILDDAGNETGASRKMMEEHYSNLLKDAQKNREGVLISEKVPVGSTHPFRDEHSHYTYIALPNFNIQGAKHLLPYDLRIPRNWKDKNIYRGLIPLTTGYTLYNIFNQPQQQLQYQKQGGKMNMLEFLKNGSGIHIKPENRGKFTKYCHGKVTDECIRKAKASGNPTLVKRATFADNARHFKHKDGGKAFVNGVNVLDSNPKMYKYNKKYKMAQEGAKLTFWQQAGNWIKDNQDSISTIGNGISNLISAKNRQDEINQFAQAKQKELKAFKYKTWKDKYLSNLQNQTDRSDIVNAHNAFNQTNINDALQEKQDEINNQIANLQYLNNQQDTGLGDITSGLLGIATNVLQGTTKKKKIDNTFSPLANQTMSQIRGKLLDINANFSE